MKNNFKKTIASCVQASITHYAGRSSSFNPDPLGWPGAMSGRRLSRADLRSINTCSKSSSVSNFARFFKRLLRLSAFRISVANFFRSCLAACCSVLSFCRYSVSVSLSKTSSTFCTMPDACALALALDFGLCFAAGFGGVPPAQGAAAESAEGGGVKAQGSDLPLRSGLTSRDVGGAVSPLGEEGATASSAAGSTSPPDMAPWNL